MSSMLSAVFIRRFCVQAYACLFVLLLLSLPCKSIFKRKPKIGRIQRSQVDPHLMSNRCNRMQNEIGYVVNVNSFVCSFLSVHSAGSKLTVRCARMSKSQGQTRELYSVLMRKRLDSPTESRWVGCSDRVWTYRLNRAGRCRSIFV